MTSEFVRRLMRNAYVINAKSGLAKRELRWDEVLQIVSDAVKAQLADDDAERLVLEAVQADGNLDYHSGEAYE